MKKILFVFFIITLHSIFVWASDWPNFLGPDRNSISRDIINKDWKANVPKVKWKVEMHDDGFSGPSIAGGKVFIIDYDGKNDVVKALDLKTGAEIWRYKYASPYKADYGQARTTPTYDNGKLYTVSRKGMLVCLNSINGKKIWSYDMVKKYKGMPPKWDISISPVIDNDYIIVCSGGKKGVLKLYKDTGKLVWRGGNNDVLGYATPVAATINGKNVYVIFTGINLLILDSENGKILWQYTWRTKYDINAATPLIIDNMIFITSGYGTGCAMLKVENNEIKKKWQNKEVSAHFSSPIYYKGYIFANSDPNDLVCLVPATGKVKWRAKGFNKGGLIIVDNVILALGGKSGELMIIDAVPDKYTKLGSIKPLGGQSWTAPIIANSQLIIRNKKAIACIDLSK